MSIETLLEAAKFVELSSDNDRTKSDRNPRPTSGNNGGEVEQNGSHKRKLEEISKEELEKSVTSASGLPTSVSSLPKTFSKVLAPKDVHQNLLTTKVKEPLQQEQKFYSSAHITPTSLLSEPPKSVNSLLAATASTSRPVWHQVEPLEIRNQSLNGNKKLFHDLEAAIRHPEYDVRWSYCTTAPSRTHGNLSYSSSFSCTTEAKKDKSAEEFSSALESSEELVSDDKRAETREVHNKLEKNRRAHLKECFDGVKSQIPTLQDRKVKTSNLSILRGALRYIQALKRKEKELEHELDRLVREKIEKQRWLNRLRMKNGISDDIELPWEQDDAAEDFKAEDQRRLPVSAQASDRFESSLQNNVDQADEHDSTSTASEAEEEERKSHDLTKKKKLPREMRKSPPSPEVCTCSSTTTTTSSSTSTSGNGPPLSGSYRHPLKSHLLREHRLQMAREAAHADKSVETSVAVSVTATSVSDATIKAAKGLADRIAVNTSAPVIPTAPGSLGMRPTVSQLLGKHNIVIRQPVRKQTPVQSPPSTFQPMTPIQRYPSPTSTVHVRPHREIAVRPSSTQPVVTIGLSSAIQARPSDSSQSTNQAGRSPQTLSVTNLSHLSVATSNKTSQSHTIPVVTVESVSSLGGSFLRPDVHSIIPQTLTLPPSGTQVLLAQPSIAGYSPVGQALLGPTLLQQVDPAPQALLAPLAMTHASSSSSSLTRTPQLYLSGNVNIPLMPVESTKLPVVGGPLVSRSGDSSVPISKPLSNTLPVNTVKNTFQSFSQSSFIRTVTTVHHTVSSSSGQRTVAMVSPIASVKNSKSGHHHRSNHVSKKSKKMKNGTLITTSMIAETLLSEKYPNGKMVLAASDVKTSTKSVTIK